jgi:hemerythrin
MTYEETEKEIVAWDEKFATGIDLIDKQHRELVSLTNNLYMACRQGTVETGFKEAMDQMVAYVRFHFTAELELLQRIHFPMYADHKKQHDTLVQQILEAAKSFNEGKKFVPNNFVRVLRDWVFGHIAVSDRVYADYVATQIRKGLLTDKQILG